MKDSKGKGDDLDLMAIDEEGDEEESGEEFDVIHEGDEEDETGSSRQTGLDKSKKSIKTGDGQSIQGVENGEG